MKIPGVAIEINAASNAVVSMTHIVDQVRRALRTIHQMAVSRGSRSV